MSQISGGSPPQPLVDGKPVELSIEHGLIGSLVAVALFGVLALIESPFTLVLVKCLILSVVISAIASIALVGRITGVLSPPVDEMTRIIDGQRSGPRRERWAGGSESEDGRGEGRSPCRRPHPQIEEDLTMNASKHFWNRFVRDEDGATMVEYGLMVALIAVVCIAAVTLLGTSLSTLFNSVQTNVANAGSS